MPNNRIFGRQKSLIQTQNLQKMCSKNLLIALVSCFIALFFTNSIHAQTDKKEKIVEEQSSSAIDLGTKTKPSVNVIDDSSIHDYVEKPPFFGENHEDLDEYLSENIEISDEMREKEVKGRVILSFVVETDGSLSNIKVVRNIGAGAGEEAVRVVSEMPLWSPAMQNGHLVRCRYTLPVVFRY
jgi:TonB family protein